MTTLDEKQQYEPTRPNPTWDAPDGYLSILVDTIDTTDSGASLNLTLTLSSGVISGELISASRWWAEMADTQTDAEDPSSSGGYGGMFRGMANRYRDRAALRRDDENDAGEQVTHIHLREARIYAPGGPGLPVNGMHWRGRISEVSGWSLGSLSGPEQS